jgi:hypothetical protein
MNAAIQNQEQGGDRSPGDSRRYAILPCDHDGLEVCLQRQLVANAESLAEGMRPGDLIFLYHAADRQLYGIWSATGEVGTFDKRAWGLRNPTQVRVDRASDVLVRVPARLLTSICRNAGIHPQILTGSLARDLERMVQAEVTRRRGHSGKPALVKWAAWAVIVVFILLVILVVWGLATHDPNQFQLDNDIE